MCMGSLGTCIKLDNLCSLVISFPQVCALTGRIGIQIKERRMPQRPWIWPRNGSKCPRFVRLSCTPRYVQTHDTVISCSPPVRCDTQGEKEYPRVPSGGPGCQLHRQKICYCVQSLHRDCSVCQNVNDYGQALI